MRVRRARGRLLLLVLGLLLFSLFVFGALLGAASASNDRRMLGDSLERTALAFRFSRARAFERLTRQAELLASDSTLRQYLQALRLTRPGSADRRDVQDALRRHLESEFGTAGGDLLMLSDRDGRLSILALRSETAPAGQTPVEPSEATAGPERPQSAPGEELSGLQEGQELSLPLLDAVYEDASPRVGYLRPDPQGPLYAVSAVPLQREGVLVLADRVGEEMLSEAVQGLSQGLVVVVADGDVLAAHDRRTSKRPSPVLLASLEEAVHAWVPPEAGEGSSPDGPGEVGEITVAGRPWMDLPMPLAGGRDQRVVAWALFLGDTSTLEEKVRREAWVLGQIGRVVLVTGLILTALLSGWVLAPVEETA